MKFIAHSGIDPAIVYNTCVGGVNDIGQRARFTASAIDIATEANAYRAAGLLGELYSIHQADGVGTVTTAEMTALYDDQMVDRNGVARNIYNTIRLLSRRCPFCSHQQVYTLDHYLPKSKFPAFAVDPINLVPACRDCNTNKGTYSTTVVAEQLLHPYFDDFSGFRWLYADYINATPSFRFRATVPAGISIEVEGRLNKHLARFKLLDLYDTNALDELCNMPKRLGELFASGRAESVSSYLRDEANTRLARNLNSWQSATYDALANNVEFCNKGWLNLNL